MQVREMARRWLGMDHWTVCGFFSTAGSVIVEPLAWFCQGRIIVCTGHPTDDSAGVKESSVPRC